MEQLEVIASEVIASYMAVLKADRAERIAKVEEAAHQWEMAAPAKITRTYLDQTISAIVQAAKGGSSTDYSPSENHPFTEDPPGSEGCA